MTNENSIRILLTEAAFRQIVDFPYKTAAVSYFCIIKIQLKAGFFSTSNSTRTSNFCDQMYKT